MKHYHYEVQGFNEVLPEEEHIKITKSRFRFGDFAVIDVIEFSEQKAIEKAKGILKKKFYRIGKVYECHQSEMDNELEQRIKMATLETQAKALKLLSPIG